MVEITIGVCMRLQMTGMVLDAPAAGLALLAVWSMSVVTTEWMQGLPVLLLTIMFTMSAALFWECLAASNMRLEGMGSSLLFATVGDVVRAEETDNRHAMCTCCYSCGK